MRKLAALCALLVMMACGDVVLAGGKPQELSGSLRSDTPYSRGSLTRFLFHVYDAELWTDAKQWSYGAPFALCITYSMGFTSQELVDSTLEEMSRIHALDVATQADYKAKLLRVLPDVARGGRITALYLDKSVVFYTNGQLRETINDAAFASRFFDIWLSPETAEPSLRNALLRVEP